MPVATTALAIKYALTLEDALTPALGRAEKSYTRFTKAIDKLNARTEKSISRTFDKLTTMIGEFSAAASRATATLTMRSAAKRGGLADQVAQGVSRALRGLKIRLAATMPVRKSAKFDSSVNLSRLYKGMAQPPDLVGILEAARAPKFAHGGLVAGTGGRDKVPALLTAGEWVMTKEQTDSMLKSAGALRKASGAFASGAGLGKVYTELKVLTAQAEKLRFAAESGMDPAAVRDYARVVERLAVSEKKLTREVSGLARETRIKLAPALAQARQEVETVTTSAPSAQTAMARWLKTIATSTAFIAIHTALKTLQEDFLAIKSASEEVSGTLGLDRAADSLVTNFQQIQREFGLSRNDMLKLRDDFMTATAQMSYAAGDVSEATEVLQGLLHEGLGKQAALALVAGAHLAAKSMNIARESVVSFSTIANRDLGLTGTQLEDTYATIGKLASASGVTADAILAAVRATVEQNRAAFAGMDPTAAQSTLESLGRLAAASEKIIGKGTGDEMAQMFGKALTLDADALRGVAATTGESMDDLRKRLMSGDLDGFFKRLQVGGPAAIAAFGQAVGLSAVQVGKLQTHSGELNAVLSGTAKVAVAAGTGAKVMDDAYSASLTTFQSLIETVGGFVKREFADFLEVLKDLNITALASAAYLAATLGPALLGVGKRVVVLTTQIVAWTWAQVAGRNATYSLGEAVMAQKGIFARLGGWLVSAGTAAWGFGTDVVAGLGKVLISVGTFTVGLMRAAVQMAAAWLIGMGPIGWITAAVLALGVVVYAFWDQIMNGLMWVWNKLAAFGKWIGSIFTAAWTAVADGALWVWDKLKEGFMWYIDMVMSLPKRLGDALVSMGTYILDFFKGIPGLIGDAITALVTWLGTKILGIIPDWVLTALNYVGVISDSTLAELNRGRGTAVAVPTATPVVPVQPAAVVTVPTGSHGELLGALQEMNAHLSDINDNTAEGASVVVKNILPRSPAAMTNLIATGAI